MSEDSTQGEGPVLILSQDYELFFQDSGTPEHCLFEPCDALLASAKSLDARITFFVDAGMICRMQEIGTKDRSMVATTDRIRRHVASLAAAGHEVALHIHPHWQQTHWRDGRWDFTSTRYTLQGFTDAEISSICSDYSTCLANTVDAVPTAYRAGGFCVEPFARLREPLWQAGIRYDSSVVPGARMVDSERGYDFRSAPDRAWWRFETSPQNPQPNGIFVEVPVTPQRLGPTFYWQRLLDRIRFRSDSSGRGQGVSRRPANGEIVRRLTGQSRTAELSLDEPKVQLLANQPASGRRVWHLMGHPKLLSRRSLVQLEEFVAQSGIQRFETVSSFAAGETRAFAS